MVSSGTVYENGELISGELFENPFYATGYPITEAYWSVLKIAGEYRSVLWQCFERRCLTYNLTNPDGWKVEAGNVGRHYYEWRYGEVDPVPAPTATQDSPVEPSPTSTVTSGPSPTETVVPPSGCHPSYPDFCIPPPQPDLNCNDFSAAQKPFAVRHDVADPDPHDLDGDKNGVACTG